MDQGHYDYQCLVLDDAGVPETVISLVVDSDTAAIVTGCELSRTFSDYSSMEIRGRGRLLYAQWGNGELLDRLRRS